MDPRRAANIADQLLGKAVGGWTIDRLLGSGKSALVLQGTKDAIVAAVKVFDPELVAEVGKASQLVRIQRELRLKGKSHQNLIEILDGGECTETGHLFVVMPVIDARDLSQELEAVPREAIRQIISQVASAAQYLESLGLWHRDIKPQNIASVNSFSRTVLLDLGVLRPDSSAGLSDETGRKFVGTLRYSSPEFLTGRHDGSATAWKAITFYQIGGVLHDLIMKRPLFMGSDEPYAVLVEAVHTHVPAIEAADVPLDLIELARNCLVKDPDIRAQIVSWEDFHSAPIAEHRVRKRLIQSRAANSPLGGANKTRAHNRLLQNVGDSIAAALRHTCASDSGLPAIEVQSGQNGEEWHVTAAWDKSATLPSCTLLCFRVSILDLRDHVIRIDCRVFLAGDTAARLGDEHPFVALFSGVFPAESATSRLPSVLYEALDRAQSLPAYESPTPIQLASEELS